MDGLPVSSYPKCPSCSKQPMPLTMHIVNVPTGLQLGLVTCCNCGHVLQTLPVGMSQPEIVKPKLILSH
jgi:uncharacterized Zn finger protein